MSDKTDPLQEVELVQTPASRDESVESAATAPSLTAEPAKPEPPPSMWTCVPLEYQEEFNTWFGTSPALMFRGVLSGLIVSMLQVPESVAFALVAKVPVLSGLWVSTTTCLCTSLHAQLRMSLTQATVFMAIICGALGGQPGQISGAAGAMVTVLKRVSDPEGPLSDLSTEDRLSATWSTVVIAGVIQIILGLVGVHKLLRLLGQPVMLGFMNGLALVIFSAQGYALQDASDPDSPWLEADDPRLWITLAYMVLVIIIMVFSPRVTKAVPGALIAIAVVSIIEHGIVRTTTDEKYHSFVVGDKERLSGVFPSFAVPTAKAWSGDVVAVWLPTALSLAVIGVIESLLTLIAVEQLVARLSLGKTDGRVVQRASETRLFGILGTMRESLAQGLGNIVSGLFGTLGGDAMIGQSIVNVTSSDGASVRLSSVVSGIGMAIIILAAAPAVEQLPLPALAGVMVMIVKNTFHWNSFRLIFRVPKSDAIAIILVSVLAPLTDLSIAVVAGVAWLSMAFAWKSGKAFKLHVIEEEEGSVRLGMSGPLFFGSATLFREAMLPHLQAGRDVTLHAESVMWDYSGMEQAHTLSHEHADKNSIKWSGMDMKDAARAARSGKLVHAIKHEEEDKHDLAKEHVRQRRQEQLGKIKSFFKRGDQGDMQADTMPDQSQNPAATDATDIALQPPDTRTTENMESSP